MAAAHRRELIHRDIKPGNILLDREHQRALVADFGLVKTAGSGDGMTATGVVMGTLDYISPEQARGKDIDGRSDLYSLGALMYQTLSGRLPFTSDSPTGMIFQHAFEQPKSLAEIAPQVSKQVVAIVMRLMAKDPAQRYATAERVLADLRAFREGRPPASGEQEAKSRIIAAPDLPAGEPSGSAYDEITSRLEAHRPAARSLPMPPRNWRERLFGLLQRHAPQAAQHLANTQQQVDGAVLEYERRKKDLQQLAKTAEEVAAAFESQAASHREAAAAAARAPPMQRTQT